MRVNKHMHIGLMWISCFSSRIQIINICFVQTIHRCACEAIYLISLKYLKNSSVTNIAYNRPMNCLIFNWIDTVDTVAFCVSQTRQPYRNVFEQK